MEAVTRVLNEVFGLDSLRPGQGEVIDAVMAGREVITVMPTGAGKSLCYQLPGVLLGEAGGVTLVVSPLIALMKDQVDSLTARGIAAAALTSASSREEQSEVLANIASATYSLVYVAPERFKSPRFVDALAEIGDRLVLLAIDEAHCISEWGHDFRPDYRRLGAVIARLGPPRVVALTATATPRVREDIAAQLGFAAPDYHVRGFDRPNLHFAVEPVRGAADKMARMIDMVDGRGEGVALVYTATRKNAERYAAALTDAGLRAGVYHAGLADGDRHAAQDRFMAGELDVIVATNAFGMGVDKDDIRVLIHADLPRSTEAYYQEVGRGGRDGEPARCVLLFNHSDVRLQEFLIDASFPAAAVLRGLWKLLRRRPELGSDSDRLRGELSDVVGDKIHASGFETAVRILARHGYVYEVDDRLCAVMPGELPGDFAPMDVDGLAERGEIERAKLAKMIEYAYHQRCRRQFVLDYFGDVDWRDRGRRCVACDNCSEMAGAHALDEEEAAQVSAALALVARLSGRFGRTRLAAIAVGSDDDHRFAELAERGNMRSYSAKHVMDLLRALEGPGLVVVSRGEYPTLSITEYGLEVLRGEVEMAEVRLLRPRRRGAAKKPARKARPARLARSASASIGDDLDPALVERLRSARSELAAATGVPAYVIFSNRTLAALAASRPESADELLQVSGIGENRLARYGEAILAAIAGN